MFRQLNLKKPTKLFLNLASDQRSTDSQTIKLKKYCKKYENTPEWVKKNDKKEDVQEDMFDYLKNIFDEGKHEQRVSIDKFLGDIQNNPDVLAKDLSESEKEAN